MASANVAERLGERTGMGARCTRCFRDGKLVHEHTTGRPIDELTDRCDGCQETLCNRHPVPGLGLKVRHDVMEHLPAREA